MGTYRKIAMDDLENALFSHSHGKYNLAVFNFQQFAEKSAKAELEKLDKLEAKLGAPCDVDKLPFIGD